MASGNIVVWMFGGISVCHILTVILLPLIIPFVNRRLRGKDWWWMIPKLFGTLPEDELREVITGEDEVVPFSKKAWKFCIEKGYTNRTAYLTSLAIEEMAMHILQNGLKMIILQAKEISYISLLNLNNLIIEIDASDGSPSAHDEGENDSEDAEGDKAAEGNGVGAGSRIDDTAQIRTEESCEDELGAAETEVR